MVVSEFHRGLSTAASYIMTRTVVKCEAEQNFFLCTANWRARSGKEEAGRAGDLDCCAGPG